jgi:hypothetical protein
MPQRFVTSAVNLVDSNTSRTLTQATRVVLIVVFKPRWCLSFKLTCRLCRLESKLRLCVRGRRGERQDETQSAPRFGVETQAAYKY